MTRVQILDKLFAFYIALIPIILPPAMGKIVGQTVLYRLDMGTYLREETC